MELKTRLKQELMWRQHRLRMIKLSRAHPLTYLFLEVTRRCNLACLYCGSSCGPKPLEGEMDAAGFVAAIDQIADDFDASKVMVAVTGGEPLIKEGIWDIFAALKRRGFPFGMVCNGGLLDAEAGRRLATCGIGSISLSMDGPPEINDQLRGKGSSDGVVAAIGHLRAGGYKGVLEIISTLTRPAVPRIDEMRAFLASLRVPYWRVAVVMPIGRAAQHTHLVPGAEEVRALLEYVRHARKDGQLPVPEFGEEGYLGRRFEGVVRPYLAHCRAGISVAGIRWDGTIAACPELSRAWDEGHLQRDRFADVWRQGYGRFRDRSWARRGDCVDCKQWSVCQGGSLHLYDSPDTTPSRCMYLMCKETDGATLPNIPCAGGCGLSTAG